MGHEPVSLIGRNGMGKSTLCNAIMQIRPPTAKGSIPFEGQELVGKPSYKVAALGIGYVPQGRRLFESLTVDEHLRMAAPRGREATDAGPRTASTSCSRASPSARTPAARSSPAASSRCSRSGASLLGNPKLLIMDEPSEGLAPAIIEMLIDTFRRLADEGLAILVVEQNLSVATSLAERQLVMVAGRISAETTADALTGDPEAQRRWLGVERA